MISQPYQVISLISRDVMTIDTRLLISLQNRRNFLRIFRARLAFASVRQKYAKNHACSAGTSDWLIAKLDSVTVEGIHCTVLIILQPFVNNSCFILRFPT